MSISKQTILKNSDHPEANLLGHSSERQISRSDAIAYISHNMNNAIGYIMLWCDLDDYTDKNIKSIMKDFGLYIDQFNEIRDLILLCYREKKFSDLDRYVMNMAVLIDQMNVQINHFCVYVGENEVCKGLMTMISKMNNSIVMLKSITALDSYSQLDHIIRFEPIQLSRLVVDTVQSYKLSSSIEININDYGSALIIDGDIYFLTNMIENLINNSVKILEKYNIGKRKIIEIDIYNDNKNAVIQFKDNGCGFKKDIEDLELFVKNHQDENYESKVRSYGVGLNACIKICKAHGGSIYAANRNDSKGAIFTIQLPLNPDKTDTTSVIVH